MSFVLVHPSTTSALNVSATAASRAACNASGSTHRVGREDGEHRRHRRREHGGAFRHATDGHPRAIGQLGDRDRLLANRVGRQDRVCRRMPAAFATGECLDDLRDARLDGCGRQGDPDEACRAHEDVRCGAAERRGDPVARLTCVVAAGLSGRGVRVPGVEHDRRGRAVTEMRSAHLHRGSAREVRREDARGRDRPAIRGCDQGEIGRAGRLDAARHATRLEACRCRDTHGISPRSGRPVGSGSPRTRFAAWIAWPAAPFTRLSSAAIASTVPVRAS